jgi:hypothetical protein
MTRPGPVRVGGLVFLLGSVGCALASSVWLLVGFRVVQGAGAAVLLVGALPLIRGPASSPQRGTVLWAAAGSSGRTPRSAAAAEESERSKCEHAEQGGKDARSSASRALVAIGTGASSTTEIPRSFALWPAEARSVASSGVSRRMPATSPAWRIHTVWAAPAVDGPASASTRCVSTGSRSLPRPIPAIASAATTQSTPAGE